MKLRNKKGVSGAISAMFVIAIFFIALLASFTITAMMASYNQTVNERSEMDWERASEHITFISAAIGANEVLNVSFSNDGGVTLHFVQVWLSEFPNDDYANATWQQQFSTSKYASSGETINDLGYFPEFKKVTPNLPLGDPTALSDLTSEYYKIKLVTERGNSFECQVPYPILSGGGSGGGAYSIVISEAHDNFDYTAGAVMTEFASAIIKPVQTENTLYRIKIKNTTNKNIVLMSNSTMMQALYAGGHYDMRWIVDEDSTSKNGLIVFSSQTILAGQEGYLFFAATEQVGGVFQLEQTTVGIYQIGFVLAFHYENESATLSLPMPVFTQQLIKK